MRNPTAVLNPRLRRYTSMELLLLLISLIHSVRSESHTTQEPLHCHFLSTRNLSSQLVLNPVLPRTLWSKAEHGPWNEKPYHEILPKDPNQNRTLTQTQTRTQTQTKTHTQKLGNINKTAPHTPYNSGGARHEISLGSILVATQKLVGVLKYAVLPGSKVLIVKVNQTTGFQGLIINRLIPWDIITPLEEGLDPLKEAPLSYGGPLVTDGRLLFSLTRRSVRDEHPEILPNVYFLDQLATVNLRRNLKSHDRSVTDYWFFLGCLKWDWNQLLDEIDDGSWDIFNGTVQQFDWPMKRWNFGLLLGRGLTYTFRG